MPDVQRVVRKLHRSQPVALDVRPMTTQVFLGIWAFLLTLLVVALGGFDETRLLHNGWFRLAAVGVSWGLLAWAAATPSRWMAQRLRLGVASSLGLHTVLALMLLFMHLSFLLTKPEPDVEKLVVTEPKETPRRIEIVQSASDQQPAFEAPTPTEELEAAEQAQPVAKAEATKKPIPEPDQQPTELAARPIPQSLAKRTPRTALTHRAKAPSKRSRQEEVAKLAAAKPMEVAEQEQAESTATAEPKPSRESLAKAKASPAIDAPEEPTPEPPTAAPKLARKREPKPLDMQPTPLAPRETRQVEHVAQAVSPTPEPRQVASVTKTQTNEEPDAPSTAEPRKAAAPAPVSVVEASPPTEQRIAAATPRRQRQRQTEPTMDASQQESREPSRQVASAGAVSSATGQAPAPMAAAVPQSTTQSPSSSPAARVLADSRGGTASRGAGLNSTDDAPAAPSYSAPFAAAAAKRNRSTQTERGPALVPTPVAKVARARASASSPSATLQALPIPNAQVAGSAQPKSASASSSAALDRQFANVPMGDITAARGEANVDTGPPQIAPERGTGRGALGGRLAMNAPATRSGLGPRRAAAASLSQSASTVPSAAGVASGATGSGVNNPTASSAGTPAASSQARVARAPAGAGTGGGTSGPSDSPSPTTAAGSGTSAPAAGATASRRGSRSGGGDGPTIASSGAPSRSRGMGVPSPATIGAALNPVAIAFVAPLSVDLNPSRRTSAGPSASADRPAPAKQKMLSPAPAGPGGIALAPSRDPGVPRRIARRTSNVLRMTPGRYANRSEGGRPTPPGRARNPAPAYAARTGHPTAPASHPADLSPKTEGAIELGLQFLASLQQKDGRWSFNDFGELSIPKEEMPTIRADGAATGLVLLAFLGGGYDHFDDKYQSVVQEGITYLVNQQGERGDIFPERDQQGNSVTRFYSHGIATLALCEAYGMTGDPTLREPVQRALDYIMETQHGKKNGWRYNEGTNSDLSVTGWQMMALRSGELAGLDVDKKTYQRVREFLERCRQTTGDKALFCYNPYTRSNDANLKHHNKPGTVMTSVGLLIQLYLGETRDSVRAQHGADHLLKNLPTHEGTLTYQPVGTADNPQRDTYYWYYGTQVMFHMGGKYWQQWHEHLHPLLVDQQTEEGELAGSWNPRYPVPDRWGPHGGRLYVTCLNLLSLEVSYRHLPLYEMTAE